MKNNVSVVLNVHVVILRLRYPEKKIASCTLRFYRGYATSACFTKILRGDTSGQGPTYESFLPDLPRFSEIQIPVDRECPICSSYCKPNN